MRISVSDVLSCLSFYSRLPAPAPLSAPDFSLLAPALPIAGAVIGFFGAGVLAVSGLLGLPPLVAATGAITASAFVTGAMHEDGLADVADGFGGGASCEQKLAIMRDSRVGAYGALALCLTTIMRVSALAAIYERSALAAICAFVFVAALSRVLGLTPMLLMGPARPDGLGASAGALNRDAAGQAVAVAGCFGVLPWIAGVPLAQLLSGSGVACCVALLLSRAAQRQIGGYTGDVCGASQQAAEIALLISLSAH